MSIADRILKEAYDKSPHLESEPRPLSAAWIRSLDWVKQPTSHSWRLEPLDHTTPQFLVLIQLDIISFSFTKFTITIIKMYSKKW